MVSVAFQRQLCLLLIHRASPWPAIAKASGMSHRVKDPMAFTWRDRLLAGEVGARGRREAATLKLLIENLEVAHLRSLLCKVFCVLRRSIAAHRTLPRLEWEPMDGQVRLWTAMAVYGHPASQKPTTAASGRALPAMVGCGQS